MLWLVQDNLYNNNRRGELIECLERLGIPFHIVIVDNNEILSKGNLSPIKLDDSIAIITNGSIMLSNIAKAKNWNPGSLFNDNFSYDIWSKYYYNFILNRNAIISNLENATFPFDSAFVRPILDNKTFNGRIFTKDEFLDFQQKSLNLEKQFPKPDTQILIAKTKNIGQEHRHYIVDGHIVTSSRYKLSGQPNFSEGADPYVLERVKEAISLWQPARAFVMDTYISGEDVGIVEIGCICHAGLYEANLMALVNSLDSMKTK